MSELSTSTALPSSSTTVLDDEISLFFGEQNCLQDPSNKKKCFYTNRYKQWKVKKNDYRINWYALGGGIGWLGYRKMYSFALYYLLACFVISTISSLYFFPDLSYIFYFIVGFFGDHLYFNYATKTIQNIKQEKLEPSIERLKIEKAGGTSVWGMIIFLFVFLLLVGI